MADNIPITGTIRPTPQNATLGAIADFLRKTYAPQRTQQMQGLMEFLGVPGAASLIEDMSYQGPRALIKGGNVATGGIGTYRLDPRTTDLADVATTVAPLGMLAAKGATRGAMALGRAGERYAERVVPQIMERGGTGAEMLAALTQGTTSNVVKPKGGNWLSGSVESAVEPLRNKLADDRAYLDFIRKDNAAGAGFSSWLSEKVAQNPDYRKTDALTVANQYLAEMGRPQLKGDPVNRWLDTKLGKYVRNEMSTPQDPIRLQADEFAAKREQLLAQKDAQIAKATADMEAARQARGFTPDMMTRSQARIRELQKERAFIEAQTGLHFEPQNVFLPSDTAYARTEAGFPRHGMGKSRAATDWEALSDSAIISKRPDDYLKFIGDSEYAKTVAENPWLKKVPPETKVYTTAESEAFADDLGFDHLMDELRNALDPNSGLPEKLRLSVDDIEKLTVPRAVKLVDEINAWRSVQQAEANAARAGNAATQVIKEYPEAGLKWVELKMPEQKKTELPTDWRVQKDVNSRGEDYYYVVNEKGEPFPGSGWIGDSPEKARANALEDLNKKDLEDALKYEGEMLQHCVGGYCPDVVSGKSRIMSLRDTEGRPRVTIEVQQRNPYLSSSGNISDAGLQKIRSMFPESNFDLEYGEWFKNSGQHSMHFAKEYAPWIQRTHPEIYEATIGAPLKQNVQQIKAKSNAEVSGADVEYVKDFLNSQPFGTVKDLPHNLVDIQDPALLPHYLKDITGQDSRGAQAIFNDAVDRNPNAPRFMTMRELRDFLKPPEGFAGGGLVGLHAKYERGGRVRPGEGLPDPTLLNLQLYADTVSREMFPGERENPQRDAARHMLASALAAQKTTPGIAELLGKAHEFKEAPLRTAGHWLGLSEPRADYRTDVHNNALGIQLGRERRSLRELLDAVEEAARSGTPARQPGRASLEPDTDTRYAEGGAVKFDADEIARIADEVAATPAAAPVALSAERPVIPEDRSLPVRMMGMGDERAGMYRGRFEVPMGEYTAGVGTGGMYYNTPEGRKFTLSGREISGSMPFLGGRLSGSYYRDPKANLREARINYSRQFAAGGLVNYDPNEIDTIVSRVKEEFHG